MAILKNRLNADYTQIPNNVITSDLNDKAFRLLVYLYSKPNDWVIYQSYIAKELNVSRATINRSFKELQEKGFVEIKKVNMGQKFEYEYSIFLEPRCNKFAKSQNYDVADLRSRKNVTHNNTNLNKKRLNNKTNNDVGKPTIEPPTEKQIEMAKGYGIDPTGKSKIKLSFEIENARIEKETKGNYEPPKFEEVEKPQETEEEAKQKQEELEALL